MSECVRVAGAEPFFSYKPRTKRGPSHLLLWLRRKSPPHPHPARPGPGARPGGRWKLPVMLHDYFVLIPSPTSPQTPTNPHGLARQQNPSSLRRAFTDMRQGGCGVFPQASGHRATPLISLSSGFHHTEQNAHLAAEEGRQRVPGGDCGPEFRAKTPCHGPCKLQCLRAGPWSPAVLFLIWN